MIMIKTLSVKSLFGTCTLRDVDPRTHIDDLKQYLYNFRGRHRMEFSEPDSQRLVRATHFSSHFFVRATRILLSKYKKRTSIMHSVNVIIVHLMRCAIKLRQRLQQTSPITSPCVILSGSLFNSMSQILSHSKPQQMFKDRILERGTLKEAGLQDGDSLVLLAAQELPPPSQPDMVPVR